MPGKIELTEGQFSAHPSRKGPVYPNSIKWEIHLERGVNGEITSTPAPPMELLGNKPANGIIGWLTQQLRQPH